MWVSLWAMAILDFSSSPLLLSTHSFPHLTSPSSSSSPHHHNPHLTISPLQHTKLPSQTLAFGSPPSRVSSSARTQHRARLISQATKVYTVEMEYNGKIHVLEVAEDETILSKALDAGLDVPYDCKLGVCMTCPAKVEQGQVDQSGGMLSEDVKEQGYALMCSSYPLSDCRIRSIPEDELLSLQLVTAAD